MSGFKDKFYIRVLGKDYELQLKSEEQQPEDLGLCWEHDQIIAVRHDLPVETFIDTILHECLHAIDYAMQLKLTERQVNGASTGVIALLRDNPALLVMLQCLTQTRKDSSASTEPKSESSANESNKRRKPRSGSSKASKASKKTSTNGTVRRGRSSGSPQQ